MPLKSFAANADRWEWYAAGDRSIAPVVRPAAALANTPARAAWEIGWVVAVPLVLAIVAALAIPG